MPSQELAVSFTCEDAKLFGIVHAPETPRPQGLLCITAGGPQYRVGCCRKLVGMARRLAAQGIPVMRFDYRGMGDSEGENLGLERSADIDAAITAFREAVPQMREVVLYGGCDGASSIAISGWRNPQVGAWILTNPYIEIPTIQAQVQLRHYYLTRLFSAEFWGKLLRGEISLRQSWDALRQTLKNARQTSNHSATDPDQPTAEDFTGQMLHGWQRFQKPVLLIISENSLTGKEFQQCVAASEAWQAVVRTPLVKQVVLAGASHSFSDPQSHQQLEQTLQA